MKKTILAVVMAVSSLALAAPPVAAGGAKGDFKTEQRDDKRAQRHQERAQQLRMMMVLGMAEALGLNESEALRLSDKLKSLDEKRSPVREQMHEAMKTLKVAAEGEASAQGQVDGAVQRILDGRQQMAVLDKELFAVLSRDLSSQKRAQLALFLGKFQHQMKNLKGRHGGREGFKHFQQLRGH